MAVLRFKEARLFRSRAMVPGHWDTLTPFAMVEFLSDEGVLDEVPPRRILERGKCSIPRKVQCRDQQAALHSENTIYLS